MFILIPLLLIVLSFIGIGIILWRKKPYLQKLTPESHQVGPLWYDLFPELAQTIQRMDIHEYQEELKKTLLLETEKLLRRIRLIFSTIDRLSDSLIKKIRHVHKQSIVVPALEAHEFQVELAPTTNAEVSDVQVKKSSAVNNPEVLKDKEQKLIIAIAQDPKDSKLYRDLGEIYVKMKNFEDAKESFEAALKFDPENEKLKQRLSFVFEKLSKASDNS